MTTPKEIQSLFNKVAPAYDILNRILSMRRDVFWRFAAGKLLAPQVDGPLLDLACGTLDLSLEVAAQYPDRLVAATDFSLPMIKSGRHKLNQSYSGQVETIGGDGFHLPYKDSVFAGATIAFGIRNMPDHQSALNEISRVIKPGGKLIVLEFGTPKGLMKSIYLTYLTKILPVFAKAFSPKPDAYIYLGRSIIDFPTPDRFISMMNLAGLSGRVLPLSNGICNLYTGIKN